jgi:hypothetical protein
MHRQHRWLARQLGDRREIQRGWDTVRRIASMIRSAMRVLATTDHRFAAYQWWNHDHGLYHAPMAE